MDSLISVVGHITWLHLGLLARLLLATLLGGAIGFEREYSGKPAGLRTNILICVGAALLTDLSLTFPNFTANELVRSDPARLAAQIVSGIGFLGAGTILQARGSITGLTTAATLWVVAAIGIAIGTGEFIQATGATALVLFTLVLLGRLEERLSETRRRRGFEVVLKGGAGAVDDLVASMQQEGLRVTCESMREDADSGNWVAVLVARGPESLFREVRSAMLKRPEVKGFRQS